MPETIDNSEPKALPPPARRPRLPRSVIAATALVGVLAAGAALGAGGSRIIDRWQPRSVMLLQPISIDQLRDDKPVAIKGEVAEIFGNKFILQDASGRALIDTGPRGERREIATKGETLTVQGRFDRGIVRADILARADGRNEAFGPPGPKGPKEMKGPKGPKGPKEAKGPPPPDDDDDRPLPPRPGRDAPPPPPPAPADGKL